MLRNCALAVLVLVVVLAVSASATGTEVEPSVERSHSVQRLGTSAAGPPDEEEEGPLDEAQMEAVIAQVGRQPALLGPPEQEQRMEKRLVARMVAGVGGPFGEVHSPEEMRSPAFWPKFCLKLADKMNCDPEHNKLPKLCSRGQTLIRRIAADLGDKQVDVKAKTKLYRKEVRIISVKLAKGLFLRKVKSIVKMGRAKREGDWFADNIDRVWTWEFFRFFTVEAYRTPLKEEGRVGVFLLSVLFAFVGAPFVAVFEAFAHPFLFLTAGIFFLCNWIAGKL